MGLGHDDVGHLNDGAVMVIAINRSVTLGRSLDTDRPGSKDRLFRRNKVERLTK